jgi:hypothetical protein
MAHMNDLRSRSKNSQVTASVYDSGRDAMIFEGFNSTVNREAFCDTSQVAGGIECGPWCRSKKMASCARVSGMQNKSVAAKINLNFITTMHSMQR